MSYVNGGSVLAVGILFPLLGLLFVAFRFIARWSHKEGLGADDWLCLPALALLVGCGATLTAGAANHAVGYSMDGEQIAPATQAVLEKLETSFYILQPLAFTFFKLSLMFFFRRLFPGRTFSIVSWVTIGTIVTWLIMFLSTVVASSALRARDDDNQFFLSSNLGNTNAGNLLGALGVINIVVNLAIIAMPLPMMHKLKMPLQRKLTACGTLLIALAAVACEIISVSTFMQSQLPNGASSASFNSGIFGNGDGAVVSTIMFWGMVEAGLIAIAVCAPVAATLAKHITLCCCGWSGGTGSTNKASWETDSCYSLELTASLNPAHRNGLHRVESRVSTPVDSYGSRPVTPAPRTILVEKNITQTVEIV